MKIRIGIVGTGRISEEFAVSAREVEWVTVTAVYSRNEQTGTAFAEKYGIADHFSDYEQFCSSRNIDAVYVATPNCFHAIQSIMAMKKGKHVLCEKPVCSNAEEYQIVRGYALKHRLVYLEAMRPWFDSSLDYLSSEMRKIGPVQYARFSFCQRSSRYDDFRNGVIRNAFDPAFSNASVMDLGVYCLAAAARLFGMPRQILSKSLFLHNGFEGSGSAILEYGDDMYVDVRYSKTMDDSCPNLISGAMGVLFIEGKLNSPVRIITDADGLDPFVKDIPGAPDNMKFEIRTFAQMIIEQDYDHEYHKLSSVVMRMLDTIRTNNRIFFPADERK